MKKLFFFLFIGVTGIGFGQSSQEIIDTNTLIIIKETDSLSELKELANKKIDAETEKMVTKTKYKGVFLNGNWILRNLLALRNRLIGSTIDASVKKAQNLNVNKRK